MLDRKSLAAMALAAVLCTPVAPALAQNPAPNFASYEPARYPDWSGQWRRPETGPNRVLTSLI